jgi:hypothetical protein
MERAQDPRWQHLLLQRTDWRFVVGEASHVISEAAMPRPHYRRHRLAGCKRQQRDEARKREGLTQGCGGLRRKDDEDEDDKDGEEKERRILRDEDEKRRRERGCGRGW